MMYFNHTLGAGHEGREASGSTSSDTSKVLLALTLTLLLIFK